MDRENRYLVAKRKDIECALSEDEQKQLYRLCEKIEIARGLLGKKPLECVVVESDWPEYDETWMDIAVRVDAEQGISRTASRADQYTRYMKDN